MNRSAVIGFLIGSTCAGITLLLVGCGDSETTSPAPVPAGDAADDTVADAGTDALPDASNDVAQDSPEDTVEGGNDAPDSATPGPVCSGDGWCWSNPLPQGNSIWAIMGSDASDIWAVGESGTILHRDGASWGSTPSGTTSWLTGLWVSSPSEAFASGENATLLRWDGHVWSPLSCQLSDLAWFDDVWAAASDDLWIAAGWGIVRRKAGSCEVAWTATSLQTVIDVWGTGPDDVWAAGWEWDDVAGRDFGLIVHWNGTAWTAERQGTSERLHALHGTGPDDIWAVAAGSDPLHWDGTSWTSYPVEAASTYEGVWGTAANDYWAVGTGGVVVHWNGTTWAQVDVGTEHDVRGVWAAPGGPIVAGGEAGMLLHSSDGSSFAHGDTAVPPDAPNFSAAWHDGSGQVWVAGGWGAVVRSNAGTWESLDTGCGAMLHAIAGSSAGDVWVAGEDGSVCRFDGSAWTQVTTGTTAPLMGIWVPAPGEAWAVGAYGTVLHGTGAGMIAVDIGVQQNFTSVWGLAPDDLWVAGTNNTLMHWDGSTWQQGPLDPADGPLGMVRAVFGTSSNDIWAATGEGMLRWDGTVWHRFTAPELSQYTALWGSSASDLYAVGLGGWAAHWNGASWQRMSTGTTNDLFGLTGVGTTAYAVGDLGTILIHN